MTISKQWFVALAAVTLLASCASEDQQGDEGDDLGEAWDRLLAFLVEEALGREEDFSANLTGVVGTRLPLSSVTRAASASPATGSMASHKLEQKRLVEEALG